MKNKIILSPSIMCGDLVNLERSITELTNIGMDTLHIDVIDGSFSPSMPLGIDTIKRMREITSMNFDIHIMSNDNEFFIGEMLKIGVEGITFHHETSLHVDRYIQLIKNAGTKVGMALNPATPLNVLDYILPEIDRVCLMLINPGFATNKNEKQIPYALKKVADLRQLIDKQELAVDIQVDGRVSLATIPGLLDAGATNLVLGSTGLFIAGNTLAENRQLLAEAIGKAASMK
ncbi:ribulose-phosphate 3-epimerase [Enterococcus xiangfangensis]|uniref:ribulose-phosphate 3-epimerase n=1 Tax=Enterococcus xiangfangensis TaxID=1296537 RepID=UPI0010FA1100|nr:ribulose-phosphate 3-epimerase [Enterococcus xiangfangensis]MBM7710915.1 ribulose-phosphate 3-epimerase [Enterococcus xiangfangensis]